ncbi:MAG: DUF3465 domain-containing protein [Nitrosomonas sp.]|nr:DUF3465 domain-containing protein [Nitrosomonas sp.]
MKFERIAILYCLENEWNEKGKVIHWTHHNSVGIHINEWLFPSNSTTQSKIS